MVLVSAGTSPDGGTWRKQMLSYYRNGEEINQAEAWQIAGDATLSSGGDVRECLSLIWRMEQEEEAREMFESISCVEVVKT
jgi:hypothetical protein